MFQPAYDSYPPAVILSGGKPVYVTLRYPDYRIDWDEVRRVVNSRTRRYRREPRRTIPTGMMWSPDDVRELARVLQWY
jgi:methionine aminotransferase